MKLVDLTGMRFGSLIVIEHVGRISRGSKFFHAWKCRCDCGSEIVCRGGNLARGNTKSCGCRRAKSLSAIRKTHGDTVGRRTVEYGIWCSMRNRCFNQKVKGFDYYGGRGITVCERWLKFTNFLNDMGRRPSPRHCIERVDNDGNYEPNNCKWALVSEQARNRRSNINLELDGVCRCLTDWAKEFRISRRMLESRIKRGMDLREALTTPSRRSRAR